MSSGRITDKARAAAHRQLSAQANGRASRLLPVIEELNVVGITSMRGIAAALDERGIATARGGPWSPAQVQRLMKRIRSTVG
jgi:Recombinase